MDAEFGQRSKEVGERLFLNRLLRRLVVAKRGGARGYGRRELVHVVRAVLTRDRARIDRGRSREGGPENLAEPLGQRGQARLVQGLLVQPERRGHGGGWGARVKRGGREFDGARRVRGVHDDGRGEIQPRLSRVGPGLLPHPLRGGLRRSRRPPRSLGDGPLARSLSLSLVLLLSLLLVNLAPGAFLDGLVLVEARGGSLVLFARVSRGFVFGLDCRVLGLLGSLRGCRARSRNLRGAPLRGQVGEPDLPVRRL